jgi:hypothetical protein
VKLLSTLRYSSDSAVGAPAGSGNHGGCLRLFFTALNAEDIQRQNPFFWKAGSGAVDTYKLPSNDVLALNLNISTGGGPPALLYIFGAIQVTTATGVVYGPPIGQGGPVFAPGQPAVAVLKGRTSGQSGSLLFDVGFELAVPWDGVSADCHGSWWAVWH